MDNPSYSDDALVLSLEDSMVPEPIGIDTLLNTLAWAHAHIVPIAHVEVFEQ